MKRKQFNMKICLLRGPNCMVKMADSGERRGQSELESSTRDGESPVTRLRARVWFFRYRRVV